MQDLRSDQQAREIKDEERALRAREREERLQRSIQSTLKKLGNTLDSSHKQLDERRSNRPQQTKGKHPEKPNKFWAASMQKVADGQKPPSKQMIEDDAPRPTNFPDLDEFLGKTPDDSTQFQKSPRRESPKSGKLKQAQELSPVLSQTNDNEDEEEEAEVISLNQDADDAMDFEEKDQSPGESPQLMVNLNNLLGGNTPDQKNISNDKEENRETITQNEFQYNKKSSKRKSKRKSLVKDQDYRPDNKKEKSTVRASYKSGRASFSLFGVPSQKPGEKGQVYVQSQDGFNKDLPPVRLSEKQRDELMQNFQELERLSSMNDESEDEALEESPDKTDRSKRAIPLTPNIDSRKKQGNVQKNNKTFWSSGVEKPNNFQEPRVFGEKTPKQSLVPQVVEFKSMAEKNKLYHQRTKTPTLKNDDQKKAFLAEYEKLMGGSKNKSGVTPATPKEEQTTQWPQTPQDSVQDFKIQKKGVLKNVYNNMLSSMFGGYGSYSGTTPGAIEDSNVQTPGQANPSPEKISPSQLEDQRQSEFFLKLTPRDRSKSPLSSRPQHSRFARVQNQSNQPRLANDEYVDVLKCSVRLDTTMKQFQNKGGASMFVNNLSSAMAIDKRKFKVRDIREGSVIVDYDILIDNEMPTKAEISKRQDHIIQDGLVDLGGPIISKTDDHEVSQHTQPVSVQYQQQPFDYRQKDPFQNPNARESLKSMHTESMSGQSPSRRRSKKTPVVMKLTSDDFDHDKQRKFLETPPFDIGKQYKDEPDMNLTITPSSQQYGTPGRSMSFASPPALIQKVKEPFSRDEIQNHAAIYQDDSELNLPNVIILVAPNVKLIRNNSVPMLQVQLEIIQNAMSFDSDMCMLGLNDVIYVVPEYTPSEYDITYARSCTGNEYDDFQPFFHHFSNYVYDRNNDKVNIPERMKGLNKNQMTAIERDHYEPDLRGKAFINLKNIPNGHYTIFYLRIGQPISINSRLKVLGMAKNIYVNINRDKISKNKKPQLDLNHSSSRISKRETSKFKILKAKASKRRDNKVLCLDSEGEDESSDEADPSLDKIDKKVNEEYQKLFKKESEETRPGSKEDQTLEMEFDEIGKDYAGSFGSNDSKSKGNDTPQPAPMQDSKEYYNSTQKMTEAMIQNPQFQIFPIDEEDSMRTSQRESTREDIRQSEDVRQLQRQLDGITPNGMGTPYASTPSANAPEDAFRNDHRKTEEETVRPTQTNRPSNGDLIADQIGNYQQEAMAQLAALMNANPISASAISSKNESFRIPAEHSQSKNLKRDSVNSKGSGSGRSGRKSTRVKTISLKDLEEPPIDNKKQQSLYFPEQQVNYSPHRDRSQSQGNSRNSNRANEEAKRGRSKSSNPRLSADNRYTIQEFDNMRETAKVKPISRAQNQQQQPFQENQNMRNIEDHHRPMRTPNTERIGESSRGSQRSQSHGGKRPWAGNRGASARRSGLEQRSNSRGQSRLKPQEEIDENSTEIRPNSQAYLKQENSARSPRRPISSSSGQDRNRFFKPYDQQSKRSGSRGGAQDRSPLRDPNFDDRKKRSQNSFINPNQFLGQQAQHSDSNRGLGAQQHNQAEQFKAKPEQQAFGFDENFSDDNQSPVRPGFVQTQQTAPLRDERNRGLRKGERRQPRF